MRKALLGLMIGLTAATPAQAERFAISCSGVTTTTTQRPGGPAEAGESETKGELYVIDEGAKTVERMSRDGTRFDEVCRIDSGCTRDFSATRITVSADVVRIGTGEVPTSWRRVSLFDWDRTTGRLETRFDMIGTTTMTMMMHGALTCKPAKIPDTYVPKA